MVNVKFPPYNMQASAFVEKVNTARKLNKDKWVSCSVEVEGKQVTYKAFNTWIQVYRVDGVHYFGNMQAKVSEFRKTLNEPFKEV